MADRRQIGYVSAYPVVVASAEIYGVATGGTSSSITVSSQNYTLLSFTSDGTLTVATAGLFDFILLGGGGSGGYCNIVAGDNAGGGGAGQYETFTNYLTAGTYAVDIGAGGSGANTTDIARLGQSSAVASVMKVCGGGGGGLNVYASRATDGMSGASGGGGNNISGYSAGGSSVLTLQYAGGAGEAITASGRGSGGGGGQTAVGGAGASFTGGAGGAGVDISVFIGQVANTTRVAGGGGGAGTTNGSGTDGGGNGGSSNGTANKGAGGGGSKANAGNGGSGGSGVVYVRFKV